MKKLIWLCWTVAAAHALVVSAAQFKIGAHNFTLPDGFEIELVAGTNLVPRPIEADFDEQGRLYVTDSSGTNDKVQKQLEDKPHRVVRLEDTDGDGRFDQSITFADKMMFPEGAMWLDGSLYVSAPPSIWKLTDTNGDGVADVRVEWFKGETLTGCANDLHGPYAGPDGLIYWNKGAFAKQTHTLANGTKFTTRASHIFRARRDGTGLEPVMTGGMDNPVGLAFTPEGERILSGTFFQHPEGGKRDGLIHAIYGGVYGKIHDVIDEHPRTGDVLPIMTHLGPAAPTGICRLSFQTGGVGQDHPRTLASAQFNLHRVQLHKLDFSGATYLTHDSDLLVSDNPDFHPTDVLEDADGSLLVIDTGGWYKLCCPTSQLHKPDVLGGIYRIRGTNAPRQVDPRGLKLRWNGISTTELTRRANEIRWAVRERAKNELAKRGAAAVDAIAQELSGDLRHNWSWQRTSVDYCEVLTRIGTPAAQRVIRSLIPRSSPREEANIFAINAAGLLRDAEAVPSLRQHLGGYGHSTRAAICALGRIGDKAVVPALLETAARAENQDDPAMQHAIIYALIEIADRRGTELGIESQSPAVRRVALIALDQMPGGRLKPEQVTSLLLSANPVLKDTASWIVGRHPEWGDALAKFFRDRLNAPGDATDLQSLLDRFARHSAIQELLVQTLSSSNTTARVMALRALAKASVKQFPEAWMAPLMECLLAPEVRVVAAAVSTVRALPAPSVKVEPWSEGLLSIAERMDVPPSVRIAAAAAVPGGIRNLSESLYSRLLNTMLIDKSPTDRADAATALARARLSDARLGEIAAHARRIGPMELPKILPAFARCTNEAVGLRLIASLGSSKSLQSLRPEILKPAVTNFPTSVQQRADELLALLHTDAAKQKAHIDELLAAVKDGDIRRGQAIFNSPQTACSACHAIGYLGGKVGPDLTRIGQVRNERDLLEALLYPNASFVRSYEPVIVATKSDEEYSGVLKRDAPDEVILVTGPTTEQRIGRSDIADMRPGTVSIMPSGLAEQLTKQELADLLAFLKATRW